MEYKRLEIYVGWTCNQRCTYCMEFPTMEKAWSVKVTNFEILKKLIKFKKLGYNHVTYLGGEPFIQGVFLDALKIGKKLGYTILVTTNCTTLHIDSIASKFLPYIDELILSLEGINIKQQQKISRTKNYVHWDLVFEQIKKYWKGTMLKTNIVITKDNLDFLFDLVLFSYKNGVKNIAITYPDLDEVYYGYDHLKKYVAPSYKECMDSLLKIIDFCNEKKINLKLPDFPFCIFPRNDLYKYIKLTDDYDFQTRLKITSENKELDRGDLDNYDITPRKRKHIQKCNNCIFRNKCWGPAFYYNELYGIDEINPIT